MVTVYFYEKPGCINNTRQKKLLEAAGHQVIARNLLTENWLSERLRLFFGILPVKDWFNCSAPAIKQGVIEPGKLTEQQALALMVENPILIRRPLMQVDDSLVAGFDPVKVDAWIGLKEIADAGADLETCSKTLAKASCSHE
jgi:nitrogenase-associated protein